MSILERTIEVKDYLVKSKLPESDFVINPYVGCPHGCKYCYANFMKYFTGHKEDWGSFIDIKSCNKPIEREKVKDREIFISSVTDCYNKYEEKYQLTRRILMDLLMVDCKLTICTKSSLILRDVELLRQFKNLKVAISINTLDEKFRSDMDNASSVYERLRTIRELYTNGIYTVLFLSPIFPEITDYKSIVEETSPYVKEYWFENLNLKGKNKANIKQYIRDEYPRFYTLYNQIFEMKDIRYWENMRKDIEEYCNINEIKYKIYFFHNKS